MALNDKFLHTMLTGLLLSLTLLLPAISPAAETETNAGGAIQALSKLERLITSHRLPENQINKQTRQVADYRNLAAKCLADGEQALKRITHDLTNLGEKVKGENWQVTSKRNSLEKNKSQVEQELAQCRLLQLRSDEINQVLLTYQKQLTKQHLLHKGPDLFQLLKENWQQQGHWITTSKQFIFKDSGLNSFIKNNWLSLVVSLMISLLLAAGLRLLLKAFINHTKWSRAYTSRFFCACLTSLRHYAIPTVGSILFIIFLTYYFKDVPDFFWSIIMAIPAFFVLITLARIFLLPPAPAVSFIPLHENVTRQLTKRIKSLLALLFIGYLFFQTILSQSLPEPAFLLGRAIFAALLISDLIWLVLLLGKIPRYVQAHTKRIFLILLIGSTLFIEWAGYRNLSFYILRALIGTVITIGFFILIKRLINETCEGLTTARANWHKTVRQWLSVPKDASIPGLIWLRILINMSLWVALFLALMHVWDFTEATWQLITTSMNEGFQVGSLKIAPTRILLAIASFALLTIITGWFKNRLASHWLKKTRLDRGAREATETISGYVGFAITIIVSLGIAGVNFTHLALIAGALSVGIGFGLQNIVNNFVSGLILLFERPIKTGDWIVVGTTEGYVKRIRIRSTQIQTFDRADVVVPNSELIARQVTNWMLYDTQGRAKIAVGVAYGSDTEKVKQILLETAKAHPLVVQDIEAYKPKVLFLRFGESSLDFELRVYVQNIDNRLNIISDLNFAIDKAFRENHIEIPFPQRDLHIRNLPEEFKQPKDEND